MHVTRIYANVYNVYSYRHVRSCMLTPRDTSTPRMSFHGWIILSFMTRPRDRSSACILRIIPRDDSTNYRRGSSKTRGVVPALLHRVSPPFLPQKTRIIPLAIRYTRLIDEPTHLRAPPLFLPSIFHFRRESRYSRSARVFSYPLKCYKSTFNGRFSRAK